MKERENKPIREKPPFQEIFEQYYFKIFQFTVKRISYYEDAQDLTSEAFAYCYEHYEAFDPEKSAVSTWLYLVVSSRIKNYYRDHKMHDDIADWEDILPDTVDMDRAVFLEQLRDQMEKNLCSLPEKQQKVVIMRYYQMKEYEEIAELLDTTPGNVRVILSRALDRLRPLCEDLR